jgi:DNA-binding NtrC family response regulator
VLPPGQEIEIGAYSPGADSSGFDDVAISPSPSSQSVSPPLSDGVVVFRPGMTMDELERQAITAALASVNGNRRKAAELLGIGERTLYRKISKYELEGS